MIKLYSYWNEGENEENKMGKLFFGGITFGEEKLKKMKNIMTNWHITMEKFFFCGSPFRINLA